MTATPGLSAGSLARTIRDSTAAGWNLFRRLLSAPEHRRLRWVLAIGLLIRFILAPLTSWAIDTPDFVESSVAVLTLGNPYASATWFNPPLGPFLSAPFMALVGQIFGINSLVQGVPSIAPMVLITGVDASLVPSPAALLAWKLPLIASDLGVALLLYAIVRSLPSRFPVSATTIAAAWFLNPLVIWASSVHGEVDTLVALFTLLFLLALLRESWIAAGFFFGLAVFAKAYPIFLLPVALVAVVGWPMQSSPVPWTRRVTALGLWIGGLAVTAALFLTFIPNTSGALITKSGNTIYGGVSVLGIFNPASPKGWGTYAAFTAGTGNAAELLLGLRILAVIGVIGALALVAWRLRAGPFSNRSDQLPFLAVMISWVFVSVLLADSAPEPENLVGLLPFLLLSIPVIGLRRAAVLFTLLSFAGILLYTAFLTPVGVFYPLANVLGGGAIPWVNHITVQYATYPLLRGLLWLIAGLIGGSALLALWLLAVVEGIPASVRRGLREVVRRRDPDPSSTTD